MTDETAERIIRDAAKKMADEMMDTLIGAGAFQKPRPTAIRVTPDGRFEVVELYDDGSVVEPPKRCPKCGPVLLCAEHMAQIS